MHIPFLVITCTEEVRVTTMLCVMMLGQKSRLDLIMNVSPAGSKSESLPFYSLH